MRNAFVALAIAFAVSACGSKTGLPVDDLESSSAAAPPQTAPAPNPGGNGNGPGGGAGFECPATPPKGGTPCDLPPGMIRNCGIYERKGCPIKVGCFDGRWETVDCTGMHNP